MLVYQTLFVILSCIWEFSNVNMPVFTQVLPRQPECFCILSEYASWQV